jgi:hypothetical protein
MLSLEWSGYYSSQHDYIVFTWSFFDSLGWSPYPDLLLAGSLFIVGTVASFFTPLGGVLQIVGCILWYSGVAPYLGVRDYGLAYNDQFLGSGFWIGIIAGVICVLSIFAPIGFKRPWNDLNLKQRLLTIQRG